MPMATPASPGIMTWAFMGHMRILKEGRRVIFQTIYACSLSQVTNFEGRI